MLCWPLSVCLMAAPAACTSSNGSSQGEAKPPAPTASLGTDPSASPSTDVSAGQESCTRSVDAMKEPPAGYRLVGEDVAIPARPVLQAAESGQPDPAARLFAKWGLVVRGGAVVDLRVASGWEDKARLGWGSSVVPAVSAHVRACASADDRPEWLAFVGGTWVARPACLPLTITSRGQTAHVQLGVGVPCDGTKPPSS